MQQFKATVLMDVEVSASDLESASKKWEFIKKHGFYKLDVFAIPSNTLEPSWVEEEVTNKNE